MRKLVHEEVSKEAADKSIRIAVRVVFFDHIQVFLHQMFSADDVDHCLDFCLDN